MKLCDLSRRPSQIRTLLLTLTYPHRVSFYDDWQSAFFSHPDFDCSVVNILDLDPAILARIQDDYDAVLILHSCNGETLKYIEPLVPVLSSRKTAYLVSFMGNEFNSPYVSMPGRVRQMKAARCDIIATQLMREAGQYLYSGVGAKVISVPHALNPDAFPPGPGVQQRPLDLGVKGYRYPPYLGDDDRNRLVGFFQSKSSHYGLNTDISEDQRLSGDKWAAFLRSCKGTISTETGSWYLQPDDALIVQIYEYLTSKRTGMVLKNESWLRHAARRLPSPIKAVLWKVLKHGPVKFEIFDDFSTSFEELDTLFFKNAPRAPVYGKAISSRHFDAIGSKTCQLMLRGRFNDMLEADTHYIAIEHDYSNMDDVISRFKDFSYRRQITEYAYEHVMSAHTYHHRASQVRDELLDMASRR